MIRCLTSATAEQESVQPDQRRRRLRRDGRRARRDSGHGPDERHFGAAAPAHRLQRHRHEVQSDLIYFINLAINKTVSGQNIIISFLKMPFVVFTFRKEEPLWDKEYGRMPESPRARNHVCKRKYHLLEV